MFFALWSAGVEAEGTEGNADASARGVPENPFADAASIAGTRGNIANKKTIATAIAVKRKTFSGSRPFEW
jgi:hypothetical protein